MVQRQDGGDGVSIGKKHLPAVESLAEPVPEAEQLCACGEPRASHFTAITKVLENPFGPSKTEYVLLCTNATFRAKEGNIRRAPRTYRRKYTKT